MVYRKNRPPLGEDYFVITFYSGTPGSGKSNHVARDIWFKLRLGRNVISTINIDTNIVSKKGKKRIGDFVYIPILDLKPQYLYEYAYYNHRKGKEGQTTIVIDEAQIIFNPREFQRKDRADWILFFTKHRHIGYNIIMISQFDRLIDRQVRCLFEYEVKHRKVNNYGLLFLLPWTFFACIEYWYGNKLVISRRFIRFNKRIASIYDSYIMFDDFLAEQVEKESLQKEEHGKARKQKDKRNSIAAAKLPEENNNRSTDPPHPGWPGEENITERVTIDIELPDRPLRPLRRNASEEQPNDTQTPHLDTESIDGIAEWFAFDKKDEPEATENPEDENDEPLAPPDAELGAGGPQRSVRWVRWVELIRRFTPWRNKKYTLAGSSVQAPHEIEE